MRTKVFRCFSSKKNGFLLERRPELVAASVVSLLCLIELAMVWRQTCGAVLLSLDDPYIDLALARQLAQHFHYGLNAIEPAAPASSILYPFLLAPLVAIGLGQFAALALGVAGAVAASVLACVIAKQAGYDLGAVSLPAFAVLVAAATLAFNIVGIAFTGLEHTLHVLACLGCIWGMARFLRTGAVHPAWLIAAFLCPLLRYEGATFWLASVMLLTLRRRIAPALLLLLAELAALGGFSLWLHANGLGWLPSSVLAKTSIIGTYPVEIVRQQAIGAFAVQALGLCLAACLMLAVSRRLAFFLILAALLALFGLVVSDLFGMPLPPPPVTGLASLPNAGLGVLWRLLANIYSMGAVPLVCLAIAALFCLAPGLRRGATGLARQRSLLASAACIVIFGHLAEGQFGWFSRYEIYALVSAAMFAVILYAEPGAAWLKGAGAVRIAVPGLALIAIMPLHAARFLQTPLSAHDIFTQQYQMRRFVQEYWHGPVAVNDLGEVAFGGGAYVLDLWGLGSHDALQARQTQHGAAWMSEIAARDHVGLAMIYTDWFGQVPASWRAVGQMVHHGPQIMLGGDTITFYATAPDLAPKLAADLLQFARTLPAADTITMLKGPAT